MSSTVSGPLSEVSRWNDKGHETGSRWKSHSEKMLSRIVSTVIDRRYRFCVSLVWSAYP